MSRRRYSTRYLERRLRGDRQHRRTGLRPVAERSEEGASRTITSKDNKRARGDCLTIKLNQNLSKNLNQFYGVAKQKAVRRFGTTIGAKNSAVS